MFREIKADSRRKTAAILGEHEAALMFAHKGQFERDIENWGTDHVAAINEINWLVSALRDHAKTL